MGREGGPTGTGAGVRRRWSLLGLVAMITVLALPARPATAAPHRSPADCAARLDCGVADLDVMSMPERLDFLRRLQRGPASDLVPGFDRWRNIEGVLEFFASDHVGRPGSWVSIVDAAILEGAERGTAIALGVTGDTFGNPGAPLWASYLTQLRAGALAQRAVHDAAWSRAEQASTEHGLAVAAALGVRPSVVDRRFFLISQVYRWTLRNERGVLVAASAPAAGGLPPAARASWLAWFTDVRATEPTRDGSALAYRIANLDPFGAAVSAVDLLAASLPALFHDFVS
ncbi:hypothetical protein [Gandjariella thermophila]|uniref:Uncharacterized protein n=1 Tax=Gandjariella thermophila TaxID=1931992 RepID=A0A4D4JB56_9PSEU|nr:hypothetical protein [Gandjariella thermophila]GDY32240.1 hypothetical protein GTS_38730 [Gandjariella thermophila]